MVSDGRLIAGGAQLSLLKNQSLTCAHIWNVKRNSHGVLRISQNPVEKHVLKLEGRLVGPWVDELTKTVCGTSGWPMPLEIDVSDLTYADEDGERTLCWLHRSGVRFKGNGPFTEFLFEHLNIPLSANRKTSTGDEDHAQN